jgi:hypothetical protein
MGNQVGIHLGIMDHFTEQEDSFSWIFLDRSKGDLNRIFHPITKTEMSCEIDLQTAEIQKGRREVLFHPVSFLPLFLNRGDQRTPVNNRDVETLHPAKISRSG